MSTRPITATDPAAVAPVGFDDAMESKITTLLARYPTAQAALLPVLWLCQERYGWISPGIMQAVAARLGESPAHVQGVVTFYTMFYTAPPARYVLQVCETLSCAVCGAKELLALLERRLGIKPGEKTADGSFQIVGVQCLGACGNAPVVQVNDDYHENLTPARLDSLLDELGRAR